MIRDEWTTFDPENFKQKLIENCDSNEFWVIDIYNSLMRKNLEMPEIIVELADIAVDIFKSRSEIGETILFLELKARSQAVNNDLKPCIETIKYIMTFDHEIVESTVLELADDCFKSANNFGYNIDQIPSVLEQLESIYNFYNKYESIFNLYIQSAYIYSRHNASQAAYRSICNAEIVAHEQKSKLLLATCLKVLNVIAFEESDMLAAKNFGMQAIVLYEEANEKVPYELIANIAVTYMNLGDLTSAVEYFKIALENEDLDRETKKTILVNYSLCLRRQSLLTEATTTLEHVLNESGTNDDPEQCIELHLASAKLATLDKNLDLDKFTSHITNVCIQQDLLLSDALRLHHRRGLRERYNHRIKNLLVYLPETGNISRALFPLVTIYANNLSDWINILEWRESLEKKNLPAELINELDEILSCIKDIGAPHLYGFREKYDDPWDPNHLTGVWDDFSHLCSKLSSFDIPLPLAKGTNQNYRVLCEQKLQQNHCLMFMTHINEISLLWYFIKDRYYRVQIQKEILIEWNKSLREFANFSINKKTFINKFDELTHHLTPIFAPIIDRISENECISLRYIDDIQPSLPIYSLLLKNDSLRNRMVSGDFEIRNVPALVEQLDDENIINSILAIIDPNEDLQLAYYDAKLFSKSSNRNKPKYIYATEKNNLSEYISTNDILLVSTHGNSLDIFSDAYFAQLGDPDTSHIINVYNLQKFSPTSSIRLAMINTCYSGSKSIRNYQKEFYTNDAVTIPNLILLNRRAVAFSSLWKISDTVSCIISYLVGQGLSMGYKPSTALTRAISTLPDMSCAQIKQIFFDNLDEEKAKEVTKHFPHQPETKMFSHPYLVAGLMIHGLL